MDISNPTTFKLVFSKLPTLTSLSGADEFYLQLYECVLPSIDFDENEIHWQGNRGYGSPIGINYGNFSTSFFIDEDFKNYLMIYDWMMAIRDGIGTQFHTDNMLDFQTDASLVVMDNFNQPVVSFRFANMHPNSLGEVTLSYQEGESYVTCDVDFLYDYFTKE